MTASPFIDVQVKGIFCTVGWGEFKFRPRSNVNSIFALAGIIVLVSIGLVGHKIAVT